MPLGTYVYRWIYTYVPLGVYVYTTVFTFIWCCVRSSPSCSPTRTLRKLDVSHSILAHQFGEPDPFSIPKLTNVYRKTTLTFLWAGDYLRRRCTRNFGFFLLGTPHTTGWRVRLLAGLLPADTRGPLTLDAVELMARGGLVIHSISTLISQDVLID